MSCHDHHPHHLNDFEPQKKAKHQHHRKHLWFMIICCLFPISVAIFLPIIIPSTSSWAAYIFILCPISHVVMMLSMRKD